MAFNYPVGYGRKIHFPACIGLRDRKEIPHGENHHHERKDLISIEYITILLLVLNTNYCNHKACPDQTK
jgi:hypothetical protein